MLVDFGDTLAELRDVFNRLSFPGSLQRLDQLFVRLQVEARDKRVYVCVLLYQIQRVRAELQSADQKEGNLFCDLRLVVENVAQLALRNVSGLLALRVYHLQGLVRRREAHGPAAKFALY